MRRWFELLQALPADCEVHLAGFAEAADDEDYRELRRLAPCVTSVEVWPWSIRLRRRPVAFLRTLVSGAARAEPYTLAKFSAPGLAERVRRLIAARRPEAVIAGIQMAQSLPTAGPPLLLDSHNIEYELWAAAAERAPAVLQPLLRRERTLLAQAERRLWQRAAAVISICAEDTVVIRSHRGDDMVFTVPVAIADGRLRAAAAGNERRWNVGLLGSWSWAPNEVALRDFRRHILPQLRQAGVTIRIAGPGMRPVTARRLRAEGVEVCGYIEDLPAFYRSVDCIAAPYSLGGGVRMKVAEAISHAVPVVGTALAFRGLELPIPEPWIRDDPSAAAAELIAVANNPAPARSLAERLQTTAAEVHAPAQARRQVASALAAAVRPAAIAAGP